MPTRHTPHAKRLVAHEDSISSFNTQGVLQCKIAQESSKMLGGVAMHERPQEAMRLLTSVRGANKLVIVV
jgi:hypothetical protein